MAISLVVLREVNSTHSIGATTMRAKKISVAYLAIEENEGFGDRLELGLRSAPLFTTPMGLSSPLSKADKKVGGDERDDRHNHR
jgi:hypothetical protein